MREPIKKRIPKRLYPLRLPSAVPFRTAFIVLATSLAPRAVADLTDVEVHVNAITTGTGSIEFSHTSNSVSVAAFATVTGSTANNQGSGVYNVGFQSDEPGYLIARPNISSLARVGNQTVNRLEDGVVMRYPHWRGTLYACLGTDMCATAGEYHGYPDYNPYASVAPFVTKKVQAGQPLGVYGGFSTQYGALNAEVTVEFLPYPFSSEAPLALLSCLGTPRIDGVTVPRVETATAKLRKAGLIPVPEIDVGWAFDELSIGFDVTAPLSGDALCQAQSGVGSLPVYLSVEGLSGRHEALVGYSTTQATVTLFQGPRPYIQWQNPGFVVTGVLPPTLPIFGFPGKTVIVYLDELGLGVDNTFEEILRAAEAYIHTEISNDFFGEAGTTAIVWDPGATDLLVTDSNGQRAGAGFAGSVLQDIPGSAYLVVDDRPLVATIFPRNGTYATQLTGLASGEFAIESAILVGTTVVAQSSTGGTIAAGESIPYRTIIDAESGLITTERIPTGDATLDGIVDHADLAKLATHFGAQVDALWTDGDFTGDGKVTLNDVMVLQSRFLESAPEASIAVPELSSQTQLSLCACSILTVMLLSKRRRSV